MPHVRSLLTLGAVAATALAPAGAIAAGATSHPHLGGSPQMRSIDSHHATLSFASDRLPRTSAGKLDAGISFINGARVSGLKATGTHGYDIVYSARVSSERPLRLHAKYTVKFRLGDSGAVTRKVKLFAVGEHG